MRQRKRTKIDISPLSVIIIILLVFFLAIFKFLRFKNIAVEPLNIELDIIKNAPISYFFNKGALANKIFSLNPEIIRVKFKPNYFTAKLEIDIETEKPIARICADECFYIGEHGYIYRSQEPEARSQKFLTIVSDLKIYDNTILEPRLVSALSKIFEFSNLKSVILKNTKILTNKDLKIITKNNWYILVDPNQNIERQIRKLNFFLDNKKEILAQIQYLDLRIPQKIYYK